MKNYYRIMLGKKSLYAEEAHKGNFIGTECLGNINLTDKLPESWCEFNEKFIPTYLNDYPYKTKISAGLASACSTL